MIPAHTTMSILEASRIEEVVGEFVSLKRRGSNLIGLCPFHQEKTPSFTVSPSKGLFKCFGCGKGGDSARFMMEHEHMTYPEALRYLAKKYQIEVEEYQQTPEEVAALNERERMFNLNTFAQNYFSTTLFETNEGRAVGLSYFKERDFREATIKKFQLGYSPDNRCFFGTCTQKCLQPRYLAQDRTFGWVGRKTVRPFSGTRHFPYPQPHRQGHRLLRTHSRKRQNQGQIPQLARVGNLQQEQDPLWHLFCQTSHQ